MGAGIQALGDEDHRGLHPPRQNCPVPQNPNSEQHGAEAGHFTVAEHPPPFDMLETAAY